MFQRCAVHKCTFKPQAHSPERMSKLQEYSRSIPGPFLCQSQHSTFQENSLTLSFESQRSRSIPGAFPEHSRRGFQEDSRSIPRASPQKVRIPGAFQEHQSICGEDSRSIPGEDTRRIPGAFPEHSRRESEFQEDFHSISKVHSRSIPGESQDSRNIPGAFPERVRIPGAFREHSRSIFLAFPEHSPEHSLEYSPSIFLEFP